MAFKPAFEVEEFSMLGVKLAAPPASFVAHYARSNVLYESHVCNHLIEALKPGNTFVDIGANIGFYSLAGAERVGPEGRVIAVEADQVNAQCILYGSFLNQFTNVDVWPVAASNRAKPEALLVDSCTNSGTRELSTVLESTYSLCVGLPVDYLLADCERVDVIKIDIEAREYPAMTGCIDTLKRHKPKVFSEFTPHAMKAVGGNEPDDYLDLFFNLGYKAEILHLDGHRIDCGTNKTAIYSILDRDEYKPMKYLDLLFSHCS
jgi:FkbM family methyltransferase